MNQNGSSHYMWALEDVSLEVKQGEIVGIIGHNGAGKSTLLKVFTRITEPTSGVIDIYGRVGSLLEVGTGFHKELTGRENVYLNGAILGMRKIEIDRKFDEIVTFAEVEEYIDTPVKYYSSGMQVRLAFAVAAHLEPEILIIDEVLAVGDAAFQKKCLNKMEDVGRAGRTILFVSHHMPSVLRLCERVVLLRKGKLVRDGSPEEIVSEYLTQNLGINASREWEDPQTAPGSDIVRLRAIRVKNEANQSNYTYDVREPIGVEMEYEVLKPGYALYPHFSVHNEEGLWLFTSIDTDPRWRGVPKPVGRYVSTAWIPGNLLTEGTRMIGPAIRTETPHIVHFNVRDAIAFQITESPEGDTARVDYPGKFPGVIRPLLKWETNNIPEKYSVFGR
ncbi:MAG TPA: ABC transporter ATP-binding protein [Anaerolineaceae bacterium]|nr:ABC transporter ATP-binding protein [Anaerolineaceae bacterium]